MPSLRVLAAQMEDAFAHHSRMLVDELRRERDENNRLVLRQANAVELEQTRADLTMSKRESRRMRRAAVGLAATLLLGLAADLVERWTRQDVEQTTREVVHEVVAPVAKAAEQADVGAEERERLAKQLADQQRQLEAITRALAELAKPPPEKPAKEHRR